jgi:hypothetical protein
VYDVFPTQGFKKMSFEEDPQKWNLSIPEKVSATKHPDHF